MTKYPKSLIDLAGSNKYFEIVTPKSYPHDCENCGGIGQVGIFIVTKGPFRDVPPPGEKDEILKSVADEHYGHLWYRGKSFYQDCPVCDGVGSDKNNPAKAPMSKREYEEMDQTRIEASIKDLADQKSVKKQGVYRDHTV